MSQETAAMGTFTTVQDTFLGLLATVLAFLPRLINAALLLIIGYFIARVIRDLLTKGLRALHFDNVADRAGITRFLSLAGTNLDAARVLAEVVFWWIFLVFIELAINALGLVEISNFLNAVLGYIPNVIAALLIIVIGCLIATVVADIVKGAASEAGISIASVLADVARWAIIIFAVLAALTQLNVAQNMIFILFAAAVAMLALAGGLAFGLGGVDTARGLLSGIMMGRMLQPGQRIRIGQETGTVVRHDMRTTIVDTDRGQISIPNAALSSEHIEMLGSDGTTQRQPAGDRK
jgi:hypothetical protein